MRLASTTRDSKVFAPWIFAEQQLTESSKKSTEMSIEREKEESDL